MTIQTRLVEYQHDATVLEGWLAWDDSNSGPCPGVLVAHAFRGRERFECERAEALAALGYVGFALDLYGKGVSAANNDEAFALMGALMADRPMLQARLDTAIAVLQEQAEVDAAQLAAIGYCFGGMCVLDMARTGAPVMGVASFHGALAAPGNTEGNVISARVLLEHGWDDPMVPPEQVLEFTAEMKAGQADWQLHAHGNTVHSFTNPQANDADFGTVYNEAANRRSWQSLQNFLAELFPS